MLTKEIGREYITSNNPYIKPYLGKRPVSSVSTAEVQKLYNRLLKEGRVKEHKKYVKALSASMVRSFHDLRHTFATMALQNKIDIKTISDILGHSTVETTINTYLHVTEQMQRSAADSIDRKIAGVTPPAAPVVGTFTEGQVSEHQSTQNAPVARFEPYKVQDASAWRRCRKPGTGYQTTFQNCWQGRFTPTVDGKRVTKNVYGKTREECEKELSELIISCKRKKQK